MQTLNTTPTPSIRWARAWMLAVGLGLGGSAAVWADTTTQQPAASGGAVAGPQSASDSTQRGTSAYNANIGSAASESFVQADVNGDGRLSRQEAQQLPEVAARFKELDRDGSDSLSVEEFQRTLESK